MLRKNERVPAGTLAQLIAGDNPSPVATPVAAWLNFTGTSPPSGNPETVSVIAGAAGAAPRCPAGCWASTVIAASTAIIETTSAILVRMAADGSTRGLLHCGHHEAPRRSLLSRCAGDREG